MDVMPDPRYEIQQIYTDKGQLILTTVARL